MTGFLGSLGANAFDVVKIRQFDSGSTEGIISAMITATRAEGLIQGLMLRGASASAPRGAAIAVGEVTTYDQTKSWLRRHYTDGFALHVVVSLITGVVATTVAAPFDLLKSRVMASSDPSDGLMRVLTRLLRNEGPLALFNGWWPTYCRLGPRKLSDPSVTFLQAAYAKYACMILDPSDAIMTFPLFEAFRKHLGLGFL